MEARDSRLFVDAASEVFAIISPHVPHTHAARVFSEVSHALQRAQEANTELSALLRASEAGLERERRLREEEVGRHLSRLRDLQGALKARVAKEAGACKKHQALRRRLEKKEARCSKLEERLRDADGKFRRLGQELEKNMQKLAHRWSSKMTEAVSEAREEGRVEAWSKQLELAESQRRTAASRQREVSDLRDNMSALRVENAKLREQFLSGTRAAREWAVSGRVSSAPRPTKAEHGQQTRRGDTAWTVRVAKPGDGRAERDDRGRDGIYVRTGSSVSESSVVVPSVEVRVDPSERNAPSMPAQASTEDSVALRGGSKAMGAKIVSDGRRGGEQEYRRAHVESGLRRDRTRGEKKSMPTRGTEGQETCRRDPRSDPSRSTRDEIVSSRTSSNGALQFPGSSANPNDALSWDSRRRRQTLAPESCLSMPSATAPLRSRVDRSHVRERSVMPFMGKERVRKKSAEPLTEALQNQRETTPGQQEDRTRSLSPHRCQPRKCRLDGGMNDSGYPEGRPSMDCEKHSPRQLIIVPERRESHSSRISRRTCRSELSLLNGHNDASPGAFSGPTSIRSPSVSAGDAGAGAGPGHSHPPQGGKSKTSEPQTAPSAADSCRATATSGKSGSGAAPERKSIFGPLTASVAGAGQTGCSHIFSRHDQISSEHEYASLGRDIVISHGGGDQVKLGGRRRVGLDVSLAWESPNASRITDSSARTGDVCVLDEGPEADRLPARLSAAVRRDGPEQENAINNRVRPGIVQHEVDTPAVSVIARDRHQSFNSSRHSKDAITPSNPEVGPPAGREGICAAHEEANGGLCSGSQPRMGLDSCLEDLLRRLELSTGAGDDEYLAQRAQGGLRRGRTDVVPDGESVRGDREYRDDLVKFGRVCV